MDTDRDAIVEVFQAEAEENLASAEDASIALESRPDDAELVNELFRAVHTVKGAADSLGFGAITSLAHAVEDLLDDLREGRFAVDAWLITLLLECIDGLRAAAGRSPTEGADAGPALTALARRVQEARAQAASRSSEGRAASGRDPGQRPPGSALRRSGTVRVQAERLDAALRRSGEIAVALERLGGLLGTAAPAEARDAHQDLVELHRDLQEQVMSLRMVPVGPTLRGFVRTVRDVAALHGKQARLVVEGAEITVDADVIERLFEPMMHLVRNAIDHGVEPPDERRARGKDPCGRIVARATREAGGVVLQIEDDGAGLRRDHLAARARALGMMAEPERADDEELFAVVFAPGFSTAERATDLSGRGVGLDAVKRAVEALRGDVAIESREGVGTTVSLRVPVTLALLDGFGVGLDDDVFVLPREAVRACMALPASAGARGPGVVPAFGRALPFVRLRELFGWRRVVAVGGRESVVVLGCDGVELGIAVDRLHGETKVMVAPASPLFRGARAVAGCSVLGSGRVALVLDVAGLFHEARRAGRCERSAAS
jgi:two-component system chemotaxis sensor kinase CheA